MTTILARIDHPVELATRLSKDDARMVELWIHGKPASTVKVYLPAIESLLADLGWKPLKSITLRDLQAHDDALVRAGLAHSTRAKRLAAIKSLFTFGSKTGYLPLDPARALKLPRVADLLAKRILDQTAVRSIVAAETDLRRRLLLLLFYATGGRISDVVNVRWEDCNAHGDGGVVTFCRSKGGCARTVRLPAGMWAELARFRPENGSGYLFPSPRRDDRPVDRATAWRWFKAAAARAGVEASPHWFRHAHASHALDHGAPVHLVAATLGHKSLATTTRYAHARPGESSGAFLLELAELLGYQAQTQHSCHQPQRSGSDFAEVPKGEFDDLSRTVRK
jgi:integrase/recombinase XerD